MNASVAIITRTFERPVLLDRAIRSVLNQQFEDWVHVIVNDGGRPAGVDLLVKHWESDYRGRCRVLHLSPGRGMQEASNAGIAAVDSEFICIHDDDDSWTPRFLRVTVDYLRQLGPQHREQGVVTQSTRIMEEFHLDGRVVELERHDYLPMDEISLSRLAEGNLFPPIALLYRRHMHERIGYFNQEFGPLGDFDFNLRFLACADLGLIDQRLANYHWRTRDKGQSVTSGVNSHRKMLACMKDHYLRGRNTPEGSVLAPLITGIPRPPAENPQSLPFAPKRIGPRDAQPGEPQNRLSQAPASALLGEVFVLPFQKPDDVWSIWEKRLVAELGLTPHTYAQARGMASLRACGDCLSSDALNKHLAELCGIDEQTAAKALELEQGLWEHYLQPAANAAAPPAELRPYIDTVGLPDAWWHGLLRKHGYAQGSIERKLTRPDLGRFGVQATQGSCGTGTCYCDEARRPYANGAIDLSSSLNIGLARLTGSPPPEIEENPEGRIYYEIGRQVAGPLIHDFLQWILRRSQALGKKRIFFLSRDGYYLHQLFARLKKKHNFPMEGVYLWGSRRLCNLARIEKIDAAALDFLCLANPSLKAGDFLTRLGLNPAHFRKEMHSCGFFSPDKMLTTPSGGAFLEADMKRRLHKLFQLLEQPLLHKAAAERKRLQSYLKDQGFDPATALVIDFGWQATSARALHQIAGNPKHPVHALYFATWDSARSAVEEGCHIESFFVHAGANPFRRELLLESPNLMEMLFQAPHPSIHGIQRDGDNWHAIYASENLGGIPPDALPAFEKGMKDFWEHRLNFASAEIDGDGQAYAEVVLERLLREPEPDEAAALGALQHSEGFGTEICFPLILDRPDAKDTDEAWETAYQQSNWKKGFVTLIEQDPRREAYRLREEGKLHAHTVYQSRDFEILHQNMENSLNARFWMVHIMNLNLLKIKRLLYNPIKFFHYLIKPAGK